MTKIQSTDPTEPEGISRKAWLAIIVAALGYFVDVFDIWLFANLRVQSLRDLGITADGITTTGAYLLNCQQVGLLVGGVLWGILADRLGRSRVMFGSIFVYSAANIANAYVDTIGLYALLRFIAGVGLAGEIGAGVTLVSELLPTARRGLGVTVVATVGVAGAIFAAFVGTHVDWRSGFLLGGVMGLALLFMRICVHESHMFVKIREAHTDVKFGSIKLLFATWSRTFRFLRCIAVGIPIWVVFGLYGVFAPELAVAHGIKESITVSQALLYASIGMTVGDLVSGLLSQRMKSRKAPIVLFLLGGMCAIAVLHSGWITSPNGFCYTVGVMGFFVGYWICALASSAEQFGTNLRGTVATSVPNLVRATVIPITIGFLALRTSLGTATAALVISLVAYAVTFVALYFTKESFSNDLDFVER